MRESSAESACVLCFLYYTAILGEYQFEGKDFGSVVLLVFSWMIDHLSQLVSMYSILF